MSEGVGEMVDFKEGYLETDFEKIVVLAMKHVSTAIRNLENRIDTLEKKVEQLSR